MEDTASSQSREPGKLSVEEFARLCVDYFMQSALTMAGLFDGDYVRAVVYLAILRENIAAVDQTQPRARPRPGRAPVPVGMSTVASISEILGLDPSETRRSVNALILSGHCSEGRKGLVANVEALNRPEFIQSNRRNAENLTAFLKRLPTRGGIGSV